MDLFHSSTRILAEISSLFGRIWHQLPVGVSCASATSGMDVEILHRSIA